MAAAQEAGFQIDFSNIPRLPNTLLAHQMLGLGNTQLTPEHFATLLERLLAAHFHEPKNIGERATLLAIAASIGIRPTDVEAWKDGGAGKPLLLDVPSVPRNSHFYDHDPTSR